MIPHKLILHNFMSYKGREVLDFSKFPLACITGVNGSGKSSLLEAISWAIWGKGRSQSDDDLIHLGEKQMLVDFEFELQEKHFRIVRKREKGKASDLQFFTSLGGGFFPAQEATIRQTQEKIIKILNLGYETFINSAFIRQGHADEFTSKKPAERKAILGEILGLSFYDELEKKAKEKAKEKEIERQSLELFLEGNKKEIEKRPEYEKEYQTYKKKAFQLQEALAKKERIISGLKNKEMRLNLIAERVKETSSEISKHSEEILTLQEELGELKNKIKKTRKIIQQKEEIEKGASGKEKEKIEEKLKELNLEIEKKKIFTGNLTEEGQEIKEKIQLLAGSGPSCPLCGQRLGIPHKKKVEEHLKEELEKKRKDYFLGKKSLLTLEEKRIMLSRGFERETKKLENFLLLKDQLNQALALDKTLQKNEISLLKTIKEKEKEITEKNKKLKSFRKDLSVLSKLQEELKAENEEFLNLKEKEKEVLSGLGEAKNKLEGIKNLEKEISKREKRLKETIFEKSIYEELAFAFSKRGVQVMIIEEAIPEIEEETNRLLSKMTEGRMKIRLLTQREKKKGPALTQRGREELIETLEIEIEDEKGARGYDLYSGGETFRIDFALRVALSKLLARRAGAKLQFLAIDEGFGSQDATGLSLLVEVIKAISSEFEKIIVISHLSELQDVFPYRINVFKDEAGSHLEVVG